MKAKIIRGYQNDAQSIGQMHVIKSGRAIFSCCTLELPYANNQRNISCIPPGEYVVKKRISPKFGPSFIINDVPNRSYILIHPGNFNGQIRGCILVGSSFKDINNDGYTDVINSGDTIKKLLDILPDEFNLLIED